MFIERQQRPTIEFDQSVGQQEPHLAYYFSDHAEPFKTALAELIQAAGEDEERVLVVTSPLSEMLDETIRLHRNPDYRDLVVADDMHRAFFDEVKASLKLAIAKIDQIQFAAVDDEEEEG